MSAFINRAYCAYGHHPRAEAQELLKQRLLLPSSRGQGLLPAGRARLALPGGHCLALEPRRQRHNPAVPQPTPPQTPSAQTRLRNPQFSQRTPILTSISSFEGSCGIIVIVWRRRRRNCIHGRRVEPSPDPVQVPERYFLNRPSSNACSKKTFQPRLLFSFGCFF